MLGEAEIEFGSITRCTWQPCNANSWYSTHPEAYASGLEDSSLNTTLFHHNLSYDDESKTQQTMEKWCSRKKSRVYGWWPFCDCPCEGKGV